MNLADIRKRHGLDEKKTEQKSTVQTTASHMLDEIRARHNLGKVSSTREKVEEAKAKPRLYKNEAEYYAKNDYSAGRTKYDELLQRDAELESLAKELETETYQGSRKGTQYINWMRDREARMDANKADREKNAAKVAEWDEFYGEGSLYGYNELAKNEDFEQNSRAKVPDYISKGLIGLELMASEDYGKADTVYNYINNIGNTREAVNEAKDPTSTFGKYDNMTDEERKLYTYIHNTSGADEANNYLKKLGLEQRGFEKAQAADEQFAKDKPVTAWLISRINNGYLTAQAGADLIMQTIKKLATGEDINYYSTAQAMHAGKGTFDAAVAEKAQEAVPIRIAGIDMTKLAVSALSSGIDSMAFSVLPGGAGAIALAVDAGISGMREAAQNGATDGQALFKGVSSAVFEYLFERVSLGNFKAMQETGISGWKDVFKNIAKSMGVNMTEEMATEAANIAYDMLIGYDYSEIKGASGRDLLKQVVEAGLSGALMGIGFGAAGNISSGVQFQQFKNQWTEEVKQQLVENGVAEEDAEKSAKLLFEMAMTAEKQSEAQGETDAANADFANKVSAENAAQTANDTAEEKAAEIERKDAYSEMVANYADSMDAAGQNVFIEAYDGSVEPDVYVKEMQDAYDAGRRGEELAESETAIGDDRRQLAYKAGISDKATADADYGFVHNEVSHTVDRKLVQNLNRIGKDLKVKIQFVDSVRGDTANGSYRNGVITISRKAENPYMVVAKHEITHHLKQTAAKSYGAYEAYAVETFAKSLGLSADALVQDRIAEAARNGDRLTAEQAREEIAADFTEMIFTDEKTLRRFVETHSKSLDGRNMLQRLFDAIRRFIARLGKMDESVLPGMGITREQLEKAERLYREVLAEGAQQRTGVSEVTTVKAEDGKTAVFDKSGEIVAETKDGKAMLSLKTYRENGRGYLVDWLDKRVQSKQLTEKEAADIVSQLDEYYKICQKFVGKYAPFGAWSEAEVVKGLDGKPAFSVIKKNGEYAMNLDFSLVCKKRRALDAVFREMINRGTLDNANLQQTDIAEINDIIRANGLETACALCFVDSKRYRVAKVADDFVSKYNEAVKLLIPEGSNIEVQRFGFVRPAEPTKGRALHDMDNSELKEGIAKLRQVMANESGKTVLWKICKNLIENPYDRKYLARSEFINSDGFEAVTTKNPRVLTLYNSSKGSGGPKASLPDVQYLGDILRDKKFDPKKAFAVGGVRIQSFSDYIPRLVFDYMQMIGDLAAKKLPAHAYTKEAMFALQFGMTGVKINLSLVPAVVEGGVAPGLDADGNYAWIDGQSFGSDVNVKGSAQKGFEQAVAIQNAEGYSANCGTIAVGISDEHIWKMLDDDRIRMVIPYHKSGLNHMVAVMNNIDKYEDYTDVQNTRRKQIDENGAEKWVKLTGKDFSFNEALRRTGDAKTATNEYLEWCERNGFKPKFDKFAKHENYYKLLEDFSCYDNGKPAMQGEVKMVFPDETSAFGSMSQLIKQGLEEDAVLEGKKKLAVPKIVDEIEKAVGSKAMMSLKKRDTEYLAAVKRGDTETAQKMVDEAAKAAGYTFRAYHGTKDSFTVFEYNQDNKYDPGFLGSGFYFTDKQDVADDYAKWKKGNGKQTVMNAALRMENPLIIKDSSKPHLIAVQEALGLHLTDFGNYLAPLTKQISDTIAAEAKKQKYDGIIRYSDFYNETTYVVFSSDQVKSADPVTYDDNGNVIPLSERFNPKQSDIRYSTKGGGLDALRKQYGEIEPGENPVRQAHVPRKTEKHKNVSQTVRTIIEAGATPDVVLPDIDQIIADGDVSREAYGDDAAIDKAKNKLNYDGWDKTISAWYESVKKGEVSKDLTTMGWVLYNNAVNDAKAETDIKKRKAKIKSSLDIIMAMVGHQRNAAQALQATRILKKLAPEAQLYGVMQSVRSLQDELEKKFKDKAPNLKIDQVLAERLLTATSEKARDEAMHDIYRDIGRQMPSTFLDKWNAWRYLAMLGNLRTHGRNIVGNAAFMPIVWTKSFVAAGLEAALISDKTERTKAMPSVALLKLGFEDFANLPDGFSSDGKYNDRAVANKYIQEGRQIFKLKNVEGARKISSGMLEKEDNWFMRPHYALALAQYCKANNVPASIFSATDGVDKMRADRAREYAYKEAEKATYKDANAVSNAVKKLANTGVKGWDLFADAVLPFRGTPANILVRAVEYSPVGLIKSISADLVRVHKGKIPAAQMIDNLAAGLTGTALLAIGVLFAKMGLVRGINGDDEEERKFQEMQGYQGYALVGNKRTYTIDWLAPQAIPFFIGVNLNEAASKKGLTLEETLGAVSNLTAPMLEMSCLQGLNDMIEAAGSVQGKGVSAMMQMVSNAATSYLTQALPTLFGQIERATESTRQQTYTDKGNKVLTPNMQYTLGKAFNKLPGDVGQIPYIDAWGRETETGNIGVSAFNNLLNPGYSAKIRTSEMEKELQRLFDETGEKSVLPDRAAKYITVEGEKIDLNKNQYVKYATVKGQTAYDMLTKITASSQYKALDEQSKVDLISKVYSYANAIAKAEVTKTQKDKAMRYQPDGWIKKAADTSKATGIPAWKYVLIYNGQTDIRGLTDKDGDTISLSSSLLMMEYLYGFIGLSDAQRQALYADFGVAKSVRHYDRQRVAQELKKMRAKAGK